MWVISAKYAPLDRACGDVVVKSSKVSYPARVSAARVAGAIERVLNFLRDIWIVKEWRCRDLLMQVQVVQWCEVTVRVTAAPGLFVLEPPSRYLLCFLGHSLLAHSCCFFLSVTVEIPLSRIGLNSDQRQSGSTHVSIFNGSRCFKLLSEGR